MLRLLVLLLFLVAGFCSVSLLPGADPLVAAAETDAEKALKTRHEGEWRALKERQKAELDAAAGQGGATLKAIKERHQQDQDAMRKRHKREWRSLKAGQ